MKLSDAFPSNFLKAADVEDEPVVTILNMKVEEIGPKKDEKCVLYFKEFEKGLVLNKTNWKTIAEVHGSEDSDDWIGKRIQLYVGSAMFQGEEVEAIRVKKRPKKQQAMAAQAPAPAKRQHPVEDDSVDDEIPF